MSVESIYVTLCIRCGRLTANLGGECTKCLGGPTVPVQYKLRKAKSERGGIRRLPRSCGQRCGGGYRLGRAGR